MLTGTPLDLTPFGPLLSALGIVYWLLALSLVALAFWLPKRWWVKLPLAAAIAAGFIVPVARHVESRVEQRDEARAKLDASMALFAERCKTAGEKITRTVDNVDGVAWLKWREEVSNADNFADQWKLNDPYGQDCGAETCIANLLRATEGVDLNPEDAKRHSAGYRFVETVNPGDGQRYRYTAGMKQYWNTEAIERHKRQTSRDPPPESYQFIVDGSRIDAFTARYGIAWEDISTREDREHWIAGGSLKVIDLQTNKVIAERVGYMVDRGQGSQAGFRSPWLLAQETSCPPSDRLVPRTRTFVQSVLRPN